MYLAIGPGSIPVLFLINDEVYNSVHLVHYVVQVLVEMREVHY